MERFHRPGDEDPFPSLNRLTGNYEVLEVVLEHNHLLHVPQTRHLIASQRKISEIQAFDIETANDSGIRPKAAYELACRRVGGPLNLSYTCCDQKNHLRTKRQRELAFGQAGSVLKYFHDKIVENPSFHYDLQYDCEEHVTNIFWLDAKIIIDCAHFGDVVTFDTTFGTNKEYRPFGFFLGLNQFRETTIFGVALLFDETKDSFTWLFETFLVAHDGRQPKTIYTNQDISMGKAIEKVFIESYHELCTFHIMQNAVKHLSPVKDEGEVEGEDEESHILSDFSACMYGCEDKSAFQEAFDNMICKVHKQIWLDSIYKLSEKWVECYMRDVFSLGVRSTQLSESFNNALKHHLKSYFHIVWFLKHFERPVKVKRSKEFESEFEATKNIPRIKMSTLMLVQASKMYTPVIFEAFQGEYERSMAACAKALDGNNKFTVSIGSLDGTFEEERIVIGDPLTQKVSCTCGIFNRVGILCAHGLKVLNLMNMKTLPTIYVLKRWTRDAQKGIILDRQGRNMVADPKLEAMLRYKNLSHKFLTLAKKIANSEECCLLLEDALDYIGPKLEDKLNASSKEPSKESSKEPSKNQENIDPNVQQTTDFLNTARLKKKEVQSKISKRTRTWIDKLRNEKRKPTKSSTSTSKGGKKQKKDDGLQPQVEVQNDGNKKGANMLHEEYNVIGSFTQLLTAPTCADDRLYDGNLF
uniref:Uncharacterized protein n=1 Tax=Avena sativa TaxID=4498 RepID=A0ACD5TMF3_AVESA